MKLALVEAEHILGGVRVTVIPAGDTPAHIDLCVDDGGRIGAVDVARGEVRVLPPDELLDVVKALADHAAQAATVKPL